MYRIAKSFTFSAAHRLEHLPETHPCWEEHGHNYTVVLILQDEALDANTMLRDFRELRAFKEWMDRYLDHKNLNKTCAGAFNPTTSENLAYQIFEVWKHYYPELVAVRIRETEATCAEYWKPGVIG